MSDTKNQKPEKKKSISKPKPEKDEVAQIAYKLWEKDGREEGKDLDHWFEAERILRSHEPYPG